MSTNKPGDETITEPPPQREQDAYESRPTTGPRKAITGVNPAVTEVAPEVSQGLWRERPYTPRGVMSAFDVLTGMRAGLEQVMANSNLPRIAFDEVRKAWLPLLRQAMEQAGGDGVDAWLMTALKPPGKLAMDPLLTEICASMTRMRAAADLGSFEEEALQCIEFVRKVMGFEKPRKLSFKQMERELEGKLDLDELLLISISDDLELQRREREIASTMETLRDQLKSMPGAQPAGVYSNFVRLKTEFRVLEAEIKRRAAGLGNQSPRPSAPR